MTALLAEVEEQALPASLYQVLRPVHEVDRAIGISPEQVAPVKEAVAKVTGGGVIGIPGP